MPEISLDEMWVAMGVVYEADATLNGLLGDNDFYVGWPAKLPTFPIMTYTIIAENPVTGFPDVGRYNPELQINIYSTLQRSNREVAGYLERTYRVPKIRTAGFTSTNFRMTEFAKFGQFEIPGFIRIEETDLRIRHLATTWRCKIRKRTTN